MQGLTRAQLALRVRKHLAEDSVTQYTDVDVIDGINRAASTLAQSLALFRRTWRTNTVIGTWSMTPPPEWSGYGYGIAKCDSQQLERLDVGPARATGRNAYTLSAVQGRPYAWTWDEEGQEGTPGAVLLFPTPDLIYPLDIPYLAVPLPMTLDTDIPWFGIFGEYHDVIALEAAHKLYGLQGAEAAKVTVFAQRRDERLMQFQTALSRNRNDGPLIMRSSLSRSPYWRNQ